ncbi:MAG: hypothetical protein V3T84_00930 [Phycisphaerales bacterium]
MMYAYSVSTKRSVVVAVVALAVVISGQRAQAQPSTAGLWAQPLQQQTVTPLGETDAPRSLSEVQPTATPLRAMLGDNISTRIRTVAPPAAPAQGGLMWFTDQAAFEAFNAGQGDVIKGIENYEESILDPFNGEVFDDPLESFVPNLPDGFPFPLGMLGLPNLIVQANIGGGDPSDENPRGVEGLVAWSDGGGGAVSDVVLARFPQDSLDLIFTDEKSGVGFNTITFGTSVQVRVYSTTNVFLGAMTTPANAFGSNFIGVWSSVPISRINIFNPSNAQEGGDNIQAWEVPCPWDFDGSGSVGAADLLSLLESWGPCKGCSADFDGDGNVGASDLLTLLANWGPCP